MELEELTDKELAQIKSAYNVLAEAGREKLRRGAEDTDTPAVVIETFAKRPD